MREAGGISGVARIDGHDLAKICEPEIASVDHRVVGLAGWNLESRLLIEQIPADALKQTDALPGARGHMYLPTLRRQWRDRPLEDQPSHL
ncbi:MAG: hypothetical protein WDO24_05075 [Pseudomonadota bacterium]